MGVGLILFAPILLFVEFQAPGLEIFGIGAGVSLIFGGILLFGSSVSASDLPELGVRVSPWLIGALAGVAGALAVLFMFLARSTGSELANLSGAEQVLMGQVGVAVSDLAPSGTVRLSEQEWTATVELGEVIREGEEVAVTAIYGSVLKVARKVVSAGKTKSKDKREDG